jgi:hypothetical protein
VEKATRGQSVAMKIQPQIALEGTRMYGRHFDHNDEIVSRVTRRSIDVLKEHFRDDLAKEDWALLVNLKRKFEAHYGEVRAPAARWARARCARCACSASARHASVSVR